MKGDSADSDAAVAAAARAPFGRRRFLLLCAGASAAAVLGGGGCGGSNNSLKSRTVRGLVLEQNVFGVVNAAGSGRKVFALYTAADGSTATQTTATTDSYGIFYLDLTLGRAYRLATDGYPQNSSFSEATLTPSCAVVAAIGEITSEDDALQVSYDTTGTPVPSPYAAQAALYQQEYATLHIDVVLLADLPCTGQLS